MAITKIQSGAFPADVITSSAIDDLSVTHAKLHTTMDLSSKTVTLPTLSSLNTTGNVGIGTSSIASNTKLIVKAATDQNFEVEYTSGKLRLSALNDARSANVPLQFASTSFEFLSGNVGIGTSSPSPNYGSDVALEIKGATSPGLVINDTGQASKYGIHADSDDLKITYGTGILATFQNDGKVGIGTTNPTAPLNVSIPAIAAGTDLQKQGIVVTTPFTSGYQHQSSGLLSGYDGTLHGTAIGMAYENPGYALTFFTNDNTSGLPIERMRINDNGRLGIGTTNPQQMLHIAGSSPQIMLEDTDASGTPYSKISGVNGHIYLQADEANELANTAIHFKVDAQEHMTLYDNGMLSLNYGTNGGWEGATSMPSLIINQSDTHRGIALRTVGNSNVGPTVSLERTRASGAQTQHGDYLGNIRFNGTTGSYIGRVAAGIEAQQRGSVVGGYAPGRLKFMTSATTATHNGQNPSAGSYAARMVINPGGDQLINGQFNHHVISGTSAPNVAFQYDFYRNSYGHPMKITTAISHWNGSYMSYKEQWVWGFNTAMASRTVDEYNGGNGSWTVSFPTSNIVRVRMNGDASYSYGSGWFIKLEGNLRREFTTA